MSSVDDILSGRDKSPRAATLRFATAIAEPLYATAIRARNHLYDARLLKSHTLPRPVISIGNLTTGGTGKTPVVRWLAEQLLAQNIRPVILLRGYHAAAGLSDETAMLQSLLGPSVPVEANASRVRAAAAVLARRPVDVFLLDDGFQHRKIARDLDVVLINAAEPFGYNHILPRGLLREPISSLRRASAIILTHAHEAPAAKRAEAESKIREFNPAVPVYLADHLPADLRSADGSKIASPQTQSLFAVCGLGSPASFERSLKTLNLTIAGHRWFPDHHRYSAQEWADLHRAARAANAQAIVTTEKDWAKLSRLPVPADALPVYGLDVSIHFARDDADRFLSQVRNSIAPHLSLAAPSASPAPDAAQPPPRSTPE